VRRMGGNVNDPGNLKLEISDLKEGKNQRDPPFEKREQWGTLRPDSLVEVVLSERLAFDGIAECAALCEFRGTRPLGPKPSGIRNLYIDIRTRSCRVDSRYDSVDISLHDWPARIAKNHDCKPEVREVLLVAEVLVGRHKYFKAGFLRLFQQCAIGKGVPTEIFRFLDRVAGEKRLQRGRRAVVKEDEHP